MNWVFPDNRFPELCSGKYFILTKAYFSDCIVSSVLIEACRRTFLHALPSHSKTYTQFLLTAYHFLTLTQPWKCGWLLSAYPDTAAKGVDMPHTNKPYKSSYRYRRYCHFPRISSSFLLCAYIIAFFRCRFGKETSAAQYPPVRNLEAVPLLRYNNVGSYLYHWI